MAEALNNSYPQQWGYTSINDFGVKELDLKVRKIEYLTRIVNVCDTVGLKRIDYEPAGISKLREITTLDPAQFNEDIVRLIKQAPEMLFTEIEEEVAKLKGQVNENKMVLRNYKVTQSAEKNTIEPAIELARKLLGSAKKDAEGNVVEYSRGACLEVICADFLADPNNYPQGEEINVADTEATSDESGE